MILWRKVYASPDDRNRNSSTRPFKPKPRRTLDRRNPCVCNSTLPPCLAQPRIRISGQHTLFQFHTARESFARLDGATDWKILGKASCHTFHVSYARLVWSGRKLKGSLIGTTTCMFQPSSGRTQESGLLLLDKGVRNVEYSLVSTVINGNHPSRNVKRRTKNTGYVQT